MDFLFPIDVERDEKLRNESNGSQAERDGFQAEISHYLFLLHASQSRGRSSWIKVYRDPRLSIFWHQFPGGAHECVIYARTSLRSEREGVFYQRSWPAEDGGTRCRCRWQIKEDYPWEQYLQSLVQPYLAMGREGFFAWLTGEPLAKIQAMFAEGDAFRKKKGME